MLPSQKKRGKFRKVYICHVKKAAATWAAKRRARLNAKCNSTMCAQWGGDGAAAVALTAAQYNTNNVEGAGGGFSVYVNSFGRIGFSGRRRHGELHTHNDVMELFANVAGRVLVHTYVIYISIYAQYYMRRGWFFWLYVHHHTWYRYKYNVYGFIHRHYFSVRWKPFIFSNDNYSYNIDLQWTIWILNLNFKFQKKFDRKKY